MQKMLQDILKRLAWDYGFRLLNEHQVVSEKLPDSAGMTVNGFLEAFHGRDQLLGRESGISEE